MFFAICSYDNLYRAYEKARKSKSNKWYVKEFENNLQNNLLQLEAELITQNYKPEKMKVFVISDPKTRVISASVFRDRVVHHAIYSIINPIFEKSFIYDSYASIKNKGTHKALKRFDYFKRKASKNGTKPCFVLKADIKHYFDTVDHEVLMKILSRKIKDEKVLNLLDKIIKNHNNAKGMPIGNLTSQMFANIYLNELDKFVKHKLKAKFYIRYLDDFVILHDNKEILQTWKNEIDGFLARKLKLKLHPDKSKIYPLYSGVNFLGFRVFYCHKLLKKSNISRIKYRIRDFIQIHQNGFVDKGEIYERIEGWEAYAMHANTYKLRKTIMKVIKNL